MNAFDTAAVLIAIAALTGYMNHRVLKLSATTGTLAVALVSSFVVVAADAVVPGWRLREVLTGFLGEIDFNETLMHGMLCFLLFAGSLHIDLEGLLKHKWTIGALATVGVLLSTLAVGTLTWWAFRLLGVDVAFVVCLVFGALISPTDPIAVMGLLKELNAPRGLEAQIAGESLFNDGIAVVVFFALVSVAGLSGAGEMEAITMSATGLTSFFLQEVLGGAALGLGFGYVGYHALKSIDDHSLELLITLALVMFMYTLSFWIHVSGPIAVVLAGLLIGNPGRKFAMSQTTREHVDAFWQMVDEILNAVLFLLIGLEVFAVGIRGLGRSRGHCRQPARRADRARRALRLCEPADHRHESPRPLPARDRADTHMVRPARGHLGRHDAVAAEISGARLLAGVHVCRRRVFDPGAGTHGAARARPLRGRGNLRELKAHTRTGFITSRRVLTATSWLITFSGLLATVCELKL